jgi:chromosome partitioning protein
MERPLSQPAEKTQVIVVGNEKGGAGKSTIVIHMVTALLHAGAKVGVIDLDLRQQSVGHFFANRKKWADANGVTVPMPIEMSFCELAPKLAVAAEAEAVQAFDAAVADAIGRCDYLVIDTPGADTALSRAAHSKADTIITPMNDSFVDFDMLGQVDPVTLDLVKPSVYSEAVWEARKRKMMNERRSVDWVVLRNRLATTEARNRKRLEERIEVLAKRVGFRMGPGMRDRVIYRELFPFGLTVADLSATIRPVPVALTHVAARQELRAVMQAAGLSEAIDKHRKPPIGNRTAANGPALSAAPVAAAPNKA